MDKKKNAKSILDIFQGKKIFIFNEDRTKYEEITCNNSLFKAIIAMLTLIINKEKQIK